MESKTTTPSRQPITFVIASGFIGILIFIFLPNNRALTWVTGYIAMVVFFIVRIYWKYHEDSRPINVPDLPAGNRKRKKKAALKLSDILLSEFDYIKDTASQAMNDRLTMLNYFLLSAGVVVATIGVMLSKEGALEFQYRNESLVALSLVFNAVGWVYFMQIVRLRQAWCESARAMNHIKEFFSKYCEYSKEFVQAAFRWRFDSIPVAEKKMTVFYLSALLVSILNSVAIGLASVILLGLNHVDKLSLIPLGLGGYHLYFQMTMYTALLKENTMSGALHNDTSLPKASTPTKK